MSLKSTNLIFAVAATVLVSGCAHGHKSSDGGPVAQLIRESNPSETPSNIIPAPLKPSSVAVTNASITVFGRKCLHNKFDYPVLVNPAVEQWITYFTGKGRRYFSKYLERGHYFIPTISKVLRAHNAPQDLVYLAMIESGFNNSAKSRARAVGPWQFIRQTGQRYGLTVDFWLDERRDTRKATLAAIAYLKELYQEFGSWELAAAGYNAGENKVRRAIAKYHTNDFWEISRHKFFKRETRDYVPKIMAAAILTKNAEMFGFVSPFNHGLKPTTVGAAIAEAKEESNEELTPKELGEPVAKDDITDDSADKPDESDVADEEDNTSDDAAIVLSSPNPGNTPSIYMVSNPNEQIVEFEIKGPADLFAISKASGLPYSTIKLLNPELLRWCTPPTMKTYRVKLPLSVKEKFLATYNDESFDRRVVYMRYTVRRGDTVTRVASRFQTEAPAIRELNQMGTHATSLRAGSAINLPLPTGYKRVIASMYDDKPMPAGRGRRHRRHRRHRRDSANASHHTRLRPNLASSDET